MPDEWRKSVIVLFKKKKMKKKKIVVLIYKNMGDIQNYNNYHEIKFMRVALKLWERLMEQRLRQKIIRYENQYGFMSGRSTMEVIFSVTQIIEKYMAKRKNLHMVFINLEKVYDKVRRDLIWWVLNKSNVLRVYIEIIKDMY